MDHVDVAMWNSSHSKRSEMTLTVKFAQPAFLTVMLVMRLELSVLNVDHNTTSIHLACVQLIAAELSKEMYA